MKKIAVLGLGILLGLAQTVHAMEYDFDLDWYRFQESKQVQEPVGPGLSTLLPQNTLDMGGVVLMGLAGYFDSGATGLVRGAGGQLLYNAGEKGSVGRYVCTAENGLFPQIVNSVARCSGILLQQGKQGLLTDVTVSHVRRVAGISSFAAQEGRQDGKVLSFVRGTASFVDQVLPYMVQNLVVSPLLQGFKASEPVN